MQFITGCSTMILWYGGSHHSGTTIGQLIAFNSLLRLMWPCMLAGW